MTLLQDRWWRVYQKKQLKIDMLTQGKDDLEDMVINLQKEMLENQDDIMDK